jgi:hypothetical protein
LWEICHFSQNWSFMCRLKTRVRPFPK